MSRREWYINLSVVALLWLLDFATKLLALQTIDSRQIYGFIGFDLYFNPGAMLGAFSGLPPVLRVVSLSTGGAFLLFIYLAIQHLIQVRATILRLGMSILLGGILGNVTDRIWRGAVTDFIFFTYNDTLSPVFNLADAVQWIGYGMIVFSLIRDGNIFWPEKNVRKTLWVNHNFQLKYLALLIGMGLGFIIISGVFFYTYLKVTIDALVMGQPEVTERQFLIPFFITYLVIATGFVLLIIIVGRILSHRTAGPLYAFEKFLDDLLSGKVRDLKLRAGDDFQHLEEMSIKLKTIFQSKAVAESLKNELSIQTPGKSEIK